MKTTLETSEEDENYTRKEWRRSLFSSVVFDFELDTQNINNEQKTTKKYRIILLISSDSLPNKRHSTSQSNVLALVLNFESELVKKMRTTLETSEEDENYTRNE